MRAIRQSGSEGGATGVTTGRPYPYEWVIWKLEGIHANASLAAPRHWFA